MPVTKENHLKLQLSVAALALVSSISSLAQARPALENGQIIEYSWLYESDSGYADINTCVRDIYSSRGKLLESVVVADFVSNSVANPSCVGLSRGQAKSFTVIYDHASSEFGCFSAYKAGGTYDKKFAAGWLCGFQL